MSLDYRDVLDENGLVSKRMPRYEARRQQLDLAGAVDDAIREGHHLVAEAGTGVGKSFAYLIPSILYAVDDQNHPENYPLGIETPTQRRVVISTHTIALQEQLFHKDIPFLNSILPLEFTSVLMKGRGNYLCLRRLHTAMAHEQSLFSTEAEVEDLQRIQVWSEQTSDGSLSDLNPQPLQGIWDEVCCEQGNCVGRSCRYYKNCFYQAASRRVEGASIIIVNHALLFSDLVVRASGGCIIPNYDTLIFDEAHTMEQVAGDHLGISLSQGQISYLLSRLWNPRTRKGLLAASLKKMARTSDLPPGDARVLTEAFAEARDLVEESMFRAEETFEELKTWLANRPGSNGRVMEPGIARHNLEEVLVRLAGALHSVIHTLTDPAMKVEFGAARQRVLAIKGNLTAWINQEDSEMVYWLEKTEGIRNQSVKMISAPINVGFLLQEMLFSEVKTVIMTSATLATEPSSVPHSGESPAPFDYFRSRVGLTNARTLRLGSPFNYRENVTLIIPKNITIPRNTGIVNDSPFYEALLKYIKETEGGAFVLFTSYALLRRTAKALMPKLLSLGYPFFMQGEGISRSKMVEKFRKDRKSVLFGTDSFWQGVDVPGDALRNVIITQLPFAVPTYPLNEARAEAITLAGGNSFREYTIPEAVIKLKQGFGRLIRTADDKGNVVIMDSRILTKSYGKIFLRALPDCRFRQD
jgi:ATP-dependent DNA helicase DinG